MSETGYVSHQSSFVASSNAPSFSDSPLFKRVEFFLAVYILGSSLCVYGVLIWSLVSRPVIPYGHLQARSGRYN